MSSSHWHPDEQGQGSRQTPAMQAGLAASQSTSCEQGRVHWPRKHSAHDDGQSAPASSPASSATHPRARPMAK